MFDNEQSAMYSKNLQGLWKFINKGEKEKMSKTSNYNNKNNVHLIENESDMINNNNNIFPVIGKDQASEIMNPSFKIIPPEPIKDSFFC